MKLRSQSGEKEEEKAERKKSWGKTGEISRMPRPAAPAEGISLSLHLTTTSTSIYIDIYIYTDISQKWEC